MGREVGDAVVGAEGDAMLGGEVEPMEGFESAGL